jgi:hypothetical protein
MFRRILPFGISIAAILSVVGCERLESERPFEFNGASEMSIQSLPDRDAIPASFGDLIGVTSSATHPVWTQAWFMREDKSIAIVWINARTGALVERVVIIPRK